MEEVKCQVCGNSLMQAFGGFFQTSTGFLCKGDYDKQPDVYEIYYDLFEDFVIQSLSEVERTLRNLHEQGLQSMVIQPLYQQVMIALDSRAHELKYFYSNQNQTSAEEVKDPDPDTPGTADPASQPATTSATMEVEDKWSCRHCGNSNFASNPICYHCRASKNGEYGPVSAPATVDFGFLTIMQTIAATSATSKWTCIRCQRPNPMTNSKCDCGFVNLTLINTSDQEEKSEPPPQPFSSQPETQSMCWACPCGYEYNLNTTNHCTKCDYVKPEASPQLPENPAPRYSLPAKPIGSTMCWACTCGYEYNLNTSDTCLKCKSEKPGTKPPQPEDFKSAPVSDSEDVWTCLCGKENTGTGICPNCPRRNPHLSALNLCSKCNMKQSAGADGMCEVCATMTVKADSSPGYWTCKPCNIKKNEIGKPCSRCHKALSVPVKSAVMMKTVKSTNGSSKPQAFARQSAPLERTGTDSTQHRSQDKRRAAGDKK